jgi:hypothetical protein
MEVSYSAACCGVFLSGRMRRPGVTHLLPARSNGHHHPRFHHRDAAFLQRHRLPDGLGIVGFTIGFAMQNVMQNFVSGVILLVQRPFRVGHAVGIAGYDGTVLKIGLRTTEMKALDGRIVFLPNADVLAQPIINYTRADRAVWNCPSVWRMIRIPKLVRCGDPE